jgi:hypothetical protein
LTSSNCFGVSFRLARCRLISANRFFANAALLRAYATTEGRCHGVIKV